MTQWTGWLGLAYLWVKAAHVTFVIFWLAGLFLLPRLYVYHQESTPGSPEDRAWIEREARVRSIILTPAMLVVWVLGLMLAVHLNLWSELPVDQPAELVHAWRVLSRSLRHSGGASSRSGSLPWVCEPKTPGVLTPG